MSGPFKFEKPDDNGNPSVLTFPCQQVGADPDVRCHITIHPNDRGGNAWFVAGTEEKPTVHPAINCGQMCGCNFEITDGKFIQVGT